jgi:hypothetical protein
MFGLTSDLTTVNRGRLIVVAIAATIALWVWAPAAAHASGCEDSWTNAAGGNWFEGTNWSKKAPPTSTEEACITEAGTYTVTMTQTSGTGTVTVKSLTVGGSLGTQTLAVGSSGSLNAVLSTTAGLSVASTGVVTLTNGEGAATNVTVVSSISNAGTIASEQASGGSRTLQGNITNTGKLAINTNTSFNGASAVLTNEGALNVAEGKQLNVSGESSVINGASGSVAGGSTGNVLVEPKSAFTEGAGTTSGTLPVVVRDGALTYTGSGSSLIALRGEGSTLGGNLSTGQSLLIESTGTENAKTTASTGFTNSGSITLTNGDGSGNNATFVLSSGTLANKGTITTEQANGGVRTLQGNIKNTGTLAINATTSYNGVSAVLTNEGTLNVAEGKQLTVSNKGSIVNGSGGKIVGAGNGLVFLEPGTSFNEGAGTTSGTKPVIVDDGALSYSPGAGASAIALHGESSTLSGNLSAGQSLSIESTGTENAKTTAGASFTNSGSITLTNGDGSGNNATLVVSSGTLTNKGTITTEVANGGARTLQGNVKNLGKLVINTNTSFNGASALLTNEGALNVAESRQLTVSNESSVTNGTGGNIAGGAGEHPADVFLSGGTFTEGAGKTTGTAPVFVDDGALDYTGAGASVIALRGSSSLSGASSAGQSLSVQSTGSENAVATVATGFTNGGTITLTNGDGSGNNATLTVTGGTLTNTGTIVTEVAHGGSRVLQGAVVNQGTLTIHANTAFNGSKGLLTNEGAIDVAEGTQLAVSNASSVTNTTGGKIVGTGTGNVFLTGGTFTEGTGTITGTKPVFIDDGALVYNGTGTGLIALRGASSLSGNLSAGQSLSIESTGSENAVTTAAESFTNGGTIALTNGDGSGNNATLVIASGTLTNSGTINSEPAIGGARSLQGNITNTGKISVNASTGDSASGATLLNKGLIKMIAGTAFSLTNSATVTNGPGGAITASGNGALIESGGTFNQGAGQDNGAEPVILENLTLNYTEHGSGRIALRGTSTLTGSIKSEERLMLQSTCSAHAVITAAAGISNHGAIELTNGDGCGNNVTLNLSGGTLTNAGAVNIDKVHGGARTIQGNLLNSQTVFLAAGEKLQLGGNFTQTSTGKLKSFIASVATFGSLSVTGSSTLGGTLVSHQTGSFKGTLGQKFAILSSGSVTGTFATISEDQINSTGLYYQPVYSSTGVTLQVVQATLLLSPNSGLPGASVTVSGSGYLPGDTITPKFTDHGGTTTTFPGVITNGSGEFSTEITIPVSAAVGAGTIKVTSAITGVQISDPFNVT